MTMPLPPLPARYASVAFVAEGAFGQVYRATLDGRSVAVKVLAPHWLGDAEAVWGFTAEARRLAGLGHPALPKLLDQGLTDDGRPFFAMSFLPGEPPSEERALPAGRVRQVLGRLLDALDYLHHQGLAHGDLKAANVLVDGD